MSSAIVSNNTPTVVATCVICQQSYYGYGNNAMPVEHGQCCDRCNRVAVIPAREAYSIVGDDAGPKCNCCNKIFKTGVGYDRHRRALRTKHTKEMMLIALSKEPNHNLMETLALQAWWQGLDAGF